MVECGFNCLIDCEGCGDMFGCTVSVCDDCDECERCVMVLNG